MTSTGGDASVTTTRTETVKLRITSQELAFLRRVAVEDDRSVSSVVRLALREYAERRGGS